MNRIQQRQFDALVGRAAELERLLDDAAGDRARVRALEERVTQLELDRGIPTERAPWFLEEPKRYR